MTTTRSIYQGRITSDPEILVGKPVLKDTRIAVEHVLQQLVANPDTDELFAAYPDLTLDDVRACLAYALALVEGRDVTPAPRHRHRSAPAQMAT